MASDLDTADWLPLHAIGTGMIPAPPGQSLGDILMGSAQENPDWPAPPSRADMAYETSLNRWGQVGNYLKNAFMRGPIPGVDLRRPMEMPEALQFENVAGSFNPLRQAPAENAMSVLGAFKWTPQKAKRLEELFAKGASATDIAAELGTNPAGIVRIARNIDPTTSPAAAQWLKTRNYARTEAARDTSHAGVSGTPFRPENNLIMQLRSSADLGDQNAKTIIGAYDALAKPAEKEAFVTRLNEMMSQRRLRDIGQIRPQPQDRWK